MGTAKSRKSRRNTSRQTAFIFLSSISLGNEIKDTSYTNEPIQTAISLHSSDSSSTFEESGRDVLAPGHCRATSIATPIITPANAVVHVMENTQSDQPRKKWTHRTSVDSDDGDVHHHKLTREDSERPIASEKIKKRSYKKDHTGLSIMSVFRHYSEKLRQSAGKRKVKESSLNRGYVHQQLTNNEPHKHRKALSYAHFLSPDDTLMEEALPAGAYDACGLDNDQFGRFGILSGHNLRASDIKREMNDQFRQAHPEILPEITLSKIRAIKTHLLEVAKEADLEISSVAHAYVYFEKLVLKNIVTKKNRKLIAACCLFLATKVNEPKGSSFGTLLETMDDELDVDSEAIREHEFAVFADLEFNLYVPRREFMPHFDRIFSMLEYKSREEYLGDIPFYDIHHKE
ncbi:uncharacterized protein BYT42DRAFT_506137 [Radiomyces spectabilis]|uniref:uncharacterized protein n=1 Tax=Radiomyces spectabilis TaxID=64574 RepID=UPI00221F3A5B|nr:uncharacterized protein BYT42DRAFT_506137 [Radiomyces spectabilis]KAI8364658.1 hypothetical protein BYT42DRAFT_506137 [Radiomyces spectabilis]